MRGGASAAPPLWVWGASAVGALALLAASVPAFLRAEAASRRPANWMYERIASFGDAQAGDAARWSAIAFGDSALGTATLQLGEMTAYARERAGLDLAFLRLTRPFGLLHHLLDAIETAIEAGPDVLLIDSWILVYRPQEHEAEALRAFQTRAGGGAAIDRLLEQPSRILAHQAYLFDTLTGSTAGQVPVETGPRAARRRAGELRCDSANRRRLLRLAERRYPLDLEVEPLLRQAVEGLLARAEAAGVRVVFFEVPKAQSMEALPGVRRKRDLTRALLAGYLRAGRVEHLEYAAALADDDTCDYVHHRDAGRDQYLPWFVGQLAALRSGEDPSGADPR